MLSLTLAGIYDNLGLETVIRKFRTVFVSDAGIYSRWNADPAKDYVLHAIQVTDIIDHQSRLMRKQQLKFQYTADPKQPVYRRGTYFSIRGDVQNEWQKKDAGDEAEKDHWRVLRSACNALPASETKHLATLATRLDGSSFPLPTVYDLINFGYIRTASSLALYYKHESNPALTIADNFHPTAPVHLPFAEGRIAQLVESAMGEERAKMRK